MSAIPDFKVRSIQQGISEVIRAEIAKIPSSELGYAKPSRILPHVQAAGYEITPSVRSTASKLLKKSKQRLLPKVPKDTPVGNSPIVGSKEIAMMLVEACGGNFEYARQEIARLESFVKRVKHEPVN